MRFPHDDDEVALPLVRRAAHQPHVSSFESTAWRAPALSDDEEEDESELRALRRAQAGLHDRLAPAPAGAITGFIAGACALGVVHLMERAWIDAELLRSATAWGVPLAASTAIAYGTAAACGAMVGAVFASVTRHLRRVVPLVIWSLVFFASVVLVVLAGARGYGFDPSARLAPAIFAATAAFAVLAAMSLPLRRRGD